MFEHILLLLNKTKYVVLCVTSLNDDVWILFLLLQNWIWSLVLKVICKGTHICIWIPGGTNLVIKLLRVVLLHILPIIIVYCIRIYKALALTCVAARHHLSLDFTYHIYVFYVMINSKHASTTTRWSSNISNATDILANDFINVFLLIKTTSMTMWKWTFRKLIGMKSMNIRVKGHHWMLFDFTYAADIHDAT